MWTDPFLFVLFNTAMQLLYVLTGYQTLTTIHVMCNKKVGLDTPEMKCYQAHCILLLVFRGECLVSNLKLKRAVDIKKQHDQLELNMQDETLT